MNISRTRPDPGCSTPRSCAAAVARVWPGFNRTLISCAHISHPPLKVPSAGPPPPVSAESSGPGTVAVIAGLPEAVDAPDGALARCPALRLDVDGHRHDDPV